MNVNNRQRTRRGGFTLVELLVVIVIIGVLASLITGAVVQSLRKGRVVRNISEIQQLSVALESFKQKFGFYPPSEIVLYEYYDSYASAIVARPNGIEAQSLAVLQRMFPRMAFNTAGASQWMDWNGDGAQPSSLPPNEIPTLLEGDQCLVFFLGGIPGISTASGAVGNVAPSCQGFAANPQNPTNFAAAPDRISPFFEFQSSRLVIYNPRDFPNHPASTTPSFNPNPNRPLSKRNLTYNLSFYSYLDTYSTSDGYGGYTGSGSPFAYFSSNNTRNGYNRFFAINSYSECSGLIAFRPDGTGTSLFPYVESIPGSGPQYHKATTFQILSAGSDLTFGCVSDPNVTPVLTWTPATAPNLFPPGSFGYDDQCNFTGSTLGVGKD